MFNNFQSKMNTYAFVFAAFLSIAFAANLDWRIIGGQKAEDGQFPYQISLRQYGSHSCGGSILNEQYILTAAHCVYGGSAEAMTVVAGTNKLNAGGVTYEVESFTIHEDFDIFRSHNDIALLKLKQNINFSNRLVAAISLETDGIGDGEDLVLSGWGRTSYPGPGIAANDLQFLKLKSITSKDCNERHTSTGVDVDETQICTFTQRGQGACHGDSGGPLVHNNKVAGIVSWGRPCAIGYPDVFTRVSSYVKWINDNQN